MADPLQLRNELSQEAIHHNYSKGPLLILAGPGTGKTYSLIETIRQKIDEGFHIDDFYEATLTNAAAENFLKDARSKISPDYSESSTLHFRAKGLLHTHADIANLSPAFTVIDGNSEDLLHGDLAARLDLSASEMKSAVKAYRSDVASDREVDSGFSRAYRHFQAFFSTLDWFDVMRKACELLASNTDVRDYEANRFEYLLIDEYQDLNPSDQRFVELLLSGRSTPLVVGDDDQSIYSGRYADASGIINFKKKYPDAKVLQLPVTSRIPSAVIGASYELISNNTGRFPKDRLIPLPSTDERTGKGFVVSVNTKSGKAEAQFIHDAFRCLCDKAVSPDDVLVLCSCRSLGNELFSRVLELDDEGRLPLQNDLGSGSLASSEDYGLVQLMRLIANQHDNLAARVIIGYLAEGSIDEVRKVVFQALDDTTTIWDVVSDDAFLTTLPNIGSTLLDFRSSLESADPALSDRELALMLANEFAALGQVREALADGEDEPVSERGQVEDAQKRVRFITLHSSKGLEADFVLIPFLEDVLSLPAADEEERRRLLYVALTRAKVGVVMSWAWSRQTAARYNCSGDGGPPKGREPSRLIEECGISPSLVPPWEDGSATEVAIEMLEKFAGKIAEQ